MARVIRRNLTRQEVGSFYTILKATVKEVAYMPPQYNICLHFPFNSVIT